MSFLYPDNELFFPHKSVSRLQDIRDQKWRELVVRIARLPEHHEESLAFALMMIRICGCLNCNPGSHKARFGCAICGQRAISKFKGTDSQLMQQFRKAREDVKRFKKRSKAKRVA
jgi:hypothetical protein